MNPTRFELPLIDGVLYIDNSSLENFVCCPRQSCYYTIHGRELNKDRIALSFGERFHCVLEHLYRTYGTGIRSAEDSLAVLKFAGGLTLDTPEDDYRTTAYLVNAVATYLEQYPAEPWTIASLPDGSPAIELPFMYPLGEVETHTYGLIKIIWTGRIDCIYSSRGRFGIMDHKTTSMMGPGFFSEFEISHQMYGYVAAAEHITHQRIDEITINGLGCRKPTRTGKMYEFSRHVIPVSRFLLDEWHTDCLSIVSNFIHQAESGYFPKHTKWCMGKYGPCQYRQVCALDADQRAVALSTSEYRHVTWSPLHPRNEQSK